MFSLLSSIFILFLNKITSETDITIGIPSSLRDKPGLYFIIGYFTNMLALRVRVNTNFTFLNFIKNMQDVLSSIFNHQRVPFADVVRAMNLKRDVYMNPLFKTVFVLLQNDEDMLSLRDLHLRPIEIHNQTAKFHFALFLKPSTDGLDGWIEYRSDFYDERCLKLYTQYFFKLCSDLIECSEEKYIQFY